MIPLLGGATLPYLETRQVDTNTNTSANTNTNANANANTNENTKSKTSNDGGLTNTNRGLSPPAAFTFIVS